MALVPGTRLGPYEILAPLGAGGMGQVFRARDTRLGRDVAIKILHSDLTADAEVRARFEREARTISSLNHPHICTLFDVGREGDVAYLVMELVEGETLAQRIADGPLPTSEVLRIGAQIADALDRAHRAQVIHRDLKPGNVMLTRTGAKLMDFGLARPALPRSEGGGRSRLPSSPTQSPTIAQPLTAEGTIVGTFEYMAPEQLAGREADARSDLWALGCVLYEMATGKRAFEGRSQAHLIAAIMQLEPAPLTQLSPMSPPALDQLVRGLLAKDPEDRIQTAHDVRLQLQWIAEGGSRAGVAAPVAARRRLRESLAWGLAGVMLLAAAALGWKALHRGPPAIPRHVTVLPPEGVTIDGEEPHTALSPDGRWIVFVATDSSAASQLWLDDLATAESRPLPGTAQAYLPFWSPDSRFIGFFADGKLRKVDVAGRNVEAICDAPDGRGGTWSRRGVILFAPNSRGGLLRVSESGGPVTAVAEPDSSRHEKVLRFPSFLPDGVHFLYVALSGVDSLPTRMGSLEGRATTWVLNGDGGAVYAPPGYLLFARDGSLLAQRFDVRRGVVRGAPQVLGPAPSATSYTGAPAASVSANGALVQRHRTHPRFGLAWVDRAGHRLEDVPTAPGPYLGVALSPQNDRVALVRRGLGPTGDIWTVDLTTGRTSRLSDLPYAENPIWSPDGKWIFFSALVGPTRNIYRTLAGGGGDAQMVVPGRTAFLDPHCLSTEGDLVYRDLDPVTGEDVWAVRVGGESKPYPVLHSRFHEVDPNLSPDGRWLSYRSDESGRGELYVTSFPVAGERARVSVGGAGPELRSYEGKGYWSRNGKELVWVGGDGVSVMAASVETAAGLRVGAPRRLFLLPPGARSFNPTSDHDRFLFLEPRNTDESQSIQMVLDWPAELSGR